MLSIKYATSDVIIFTIANELFYLVLRDGPCVLDARLAQLNVPNIDIWLQAHTGHRYSLAMVREMGTAFCDGMAGMHTQSDLVAASVDAADMVRDALFARGMIADYAHHFWIEVCGQMRVGKSYVYIRDHFEEIRQRLGDAVLYNDLCRWWKLCDARWPNDAAVFERLIQRLGKQPDTPRYPSTTPLDNKLKQLVAQQTAKKHPLVKGVSNEIVKNAHDLQAGKLRRG